MNPIRPLRLGRQLLATLALGTCLATGALAEDIDIYAGSNLDAMIPNVLFMLDNTSNWSAASQAWVASSVWSKEKAKATAACTVQGLLDATCYSKAIAKAQSLIEAVFYYGIPTGLATGAKKRPWEIGFVANRDDVSLKQGQVELRTLRLVITTSICSATSTLRVKIGYMLFDDAGSVRSNGDRPGYIRRAVKLLTMTPRADGSSTCSDVINDLTTIDLNITQPEFKGPANADYGSALFEAFKYFGGYTYPGNNSAASAVGAMGYGPVRFSNAINLEDPAAFIDAAKTTYKSPIDPAGCSRSFLVVVGNGYPNSEPSGPASFQGLQYTPPTLLEDPSRYADEWSQFLANTDVSSAANKQGIVTYTLDVFNANPSASQGTLLKSMAEHGGGQYVKVGGSLSDLFDSFNDMLIKMASIDSVFTATTLPVSTTTQGTYLNQLFIGMFRPDGDGRPRWVGNLKQYKLGLLGNGDVQVVDSLNNPALTSGTGFFSPLALSYWTTDSVFFNNHKMGTPESASDAPDGQVVEKGGVAQRLREANISGASGRPIYTLPMTPPASGSLLASFTATNPGTGVFSTDEYNWIRGENNVTSGSGMEYAGVVKDATGSLVNLGITGPRPSIHGDILHSRPVAVNYGSGNVVVYYGSNEGMLRAVNGNQSGTDAGQEFWSFIAPEHYAMLHRQRSDDPSLYLPSTDASGNPATQLDGTAKKDYAFDGPIGLFAQYSASTGALTRGSIFAAMRRGGRSVYAFDILNPRSPRFLWKVSNTTAGFDKLAQTWSMPRPVIFPPAYSANPIILMGGGYDPAEDSNNSTGIGNRVYMINAATGAKMGELQTDYSVAGDVTVVDTNGDKVYDRAYVVDVRGNLYRINMTDANGVLLPVPNWTIRKIAELRGKVFGAPDVIVTKNFVAVMIGTGDREKPLMTSTQDRFFLVKDTLIGQAERDHVLGISDMTMVARVDSNNTDDATFTDVNSNVTTDNGCYIALSTRGEKVVNSPFTIAGATYFGTNRPTPEVASCTGSRGQARTYAFPLFCGVPKGVVLDGGGMPPSPVGGLVTITDPDGKPTLVPFIIGSGAGKSPFQAERPRPPITPSRKRNFWHINDTNR